MTSVTTNKPRVLIVVAIPMTLRVFLLPYIHALCESYHVTVTCADSDPLLQEALPAGVELRTVDIHRDINPYRDFLALLALIRLISAGHFTMVHSVTPKAGLLAMLAAWWCNVPYRLHMFTGQVWVTRKGLFRHVLKKLDSLIAYSATHLLADSESQKQFLISEGIVNPRKITVLGQGSISGVDLDRFKPDQAARQRIRQQLGYSDSDIVALFVGRLNRDKGVLDLVKAFARVYPNLPNLALLLVGPDEENISGEIESLVGGSTRLRVHSSTPRPEEFMASADFFCLPSYREGFGTVVIEAAACGLPTMASAIYGLTDAVEDGKSGCLHPPGDISAIAELLERLTVDNDLRYSLAKYAHQRASALFSTASVIATQIQFIDGLLGKFRRSTSL